ncbi:sugar transferase [Streptococcus saliviloxodontae]|uniref:Exopolysaccharide biosynthesis polyprenyl glycosylphosphotransferase n=1 Tax=Streptococcus saliviloxodontae TaxID=1349416 RepID=A0ABS2PJZ5_9STRE|nr:sugar transferase [Streptococcus saliviloxodontae]MBM7635597.1 exopolysaccharide biosynthesis polyprenyl glycosylphosphotransferase [Streptococcus saliviloxodontae]
MIKGKDESQKHILALLTLIIVYISGFFAMYLPYSDLTKGGLIILLVLHLLIFYVSEFYDAYKRNSYFETFLAVFKYSVYMLLMMGFLTFMIKDETLISRRGIFFFSVINLSLMSCFMFSMRNYRLRKYQYRAKQLYVITVNDRLEAIEDSITNHSNVGYQIAGVTLLDSQEANSNSQLISQEEFVEFTTKSVIDEVFINLPSDEYNIQDYITFFENMGLPVSVAINALGYDITGSKTIQKLGTYQVVTLSPVALKYSHIIAKRMLDIVGALVGLLICGLAGIVLVPLIKKDGGPAIFSQKRVGQNGRLFDFYKFRSMRVDAEEIKKKLMSQNEMNGLMFKMDDDPRITRIGKIIRKLSLDELPQFWNVLKGDMSLVGTRPPTLDEYEQYTPEQKRRLSFRPGITGNWQVSGRSEIKDFDDIVKLDVDYINNWTIWSDIHILVKTVKVVLLGSGAK